MTSEPCLGLPAWLELDQSGAQYEVTVKTETSVSQIRLSDFDRFQPSLATRVGDGDRVNLHPSGA
jgi:hypothetical protein